MGLRDDRICIYHDSALCRPKAPTKGDNEVLKTKIDRRSAIIATAVGMTGYAVGARPAAAESADQPGVRDENPGIVEIYQKLPDAIAEYEAAVAARWEKAYGSQQWAVAKRQAECAYARVQKLVSEGSSLNPWTLAGIVMQARILHAYTALAPGGGLDCYYSWRLPGDLDRIMSVHVNVPEWPVMRITRGNWA